MKILILIAAVVLFGLALTLPPTPIHAAAPGAMNGGDWATRGYSSARKQKNMAQPKAVHQKKTK
jgi:hypothetical protein